MFTTCRKENSILKSNRTIASIFKQWENNHFSNVALHFRQVFAERVFKILLIQIVKQVPLKRNCLPRNSRYY